MAETGDDLVPAFAAPASQQQSPTSPPAAGQPTPSAPSVEDVPLERLLPCLSPVFTACANFPIPTTHTECEIDKPFIIDFGGLAESPPIIGVGIDVIDAFENELATTYGVAIPRIAPALREALDCEIVTG